MTAKMPRCPSCGIRLEWPDKVSRCERMGLKVMESIKCAKCPSVVDLCADTDNLFVLCWCPNAPMRVQVKS